MNLPVVQKGSFLISGFLLLWILLNSFSAIYTGLAHDEAYYWMYSQNLDWGFFDHPPAVAVLIKTGYSIFGSEFGVRMVNVILVTVSLAALWQICRKYGEDHLLFIGMVSGIVIFHVYGFVIVPDAPLLVSTVLYFWALDKYLNAEKPAYILLLILAVAFMLYSKYHGFLVLLFTLVAAPYLLQRKSFWIIFSISFLLLLPHILWQIDNGYPSLQYHLVERHNRAYEISNTTNYILGILLITGPLIGFTLFYALVKVKIQDEWERIMKYTVVGFIIFFFLVSFRGKIEPNWNSVIVIPLFILGYKFLIKQFQLRKWTLILGGITFGLTLFLRIYLASDILHRELAHIIPLKNEFHHWDKWSSEIAEKAGERPVMFYDSYQKASKYTFYSGKPAFSYNTIQFRKNQYDYWNIESEVQGKDVLIIHQNEGPDLASLNTKLGKIFLYEIKNFQSFKQITVSNLCEPLILEAETNHKIEVDLKNAFPYPVDLCRNSDMNSEIVLMILNEKQLILQNIFIPVQKRLDPGETFLQSVDFTTPKEKGEYDLVVTVKNKLLPLKRNYRAVKLIVQ